MEQHPVPRNITGFQFKLIGDMTLRQFGYLATAVVVGYVLFKFLPLGFVVNITLAGLIVFVGFAVAFIPLQDRPLDQWMLAFIKSISSPTEFIYKKDNLPPEILAHVSVRTVKASSQHYTSQYQASKKMLEIYLARAGAKGDVYEQNEKVRVSQTLMLFSQVTPIIKKSAPSTTSSSLPKSTPVASASAAASAHIAEAMKAKPTPPPVHKIEVPNKIESQKEALAAEKRVSELTNELTKLKTQIVKQAPTPTAPSDPHLTQKFLDLESKLNTLMSEREHLTAEISQLRQQSSVQGSMVRPTISKESLVAPMKVTMVGQRKASTLGFLNLPTTPNIVIGVINDQTGVGLSNVLITVKDLRGTPLRALKTNKLGQFFASTPLPKGTYVLEVEDPQKKYSFDLIEIKLTGTMLAPLEITAKQQVDPVREKLAKELFQKPFA